jgi:hypothetical protein
VSVRGGATFGSTRDASWCPHIEAASPRGYAPANRWVLVRASRRPRAPALLVGLFRSFPALQRSPCGCTRRAKSSRRPVAPRRSAPAARPPPWAARPKLARTIGRLDKGDSPAGRTPPQMAASSLGRRFIGARPYRPRRRGGVQTDQPDARRSFSRLTRAVHRAPRRETAFARMARAFAASRTTPIATSGGSSPSSSTQARSCHICRRRGDDHCATASTPATR